MHSLTRRHSCTSTILLLVLASCWPLLPGGAVRAWGQEASDAGARPAVGPNGVVVQSQFGGQIFGFDIDPDGTEGVLTEAAFLPSGKLLAAVETFDQATGQILKVVKRRTGKDDFVTLGIGNGIGIVEWEHVKGIFVDSRTYPILNPLSGNKVTGEWTPPLEKDDIIISIRGNQGARKIAVFAFENGGDNHSFVFGSDVAANTFGPLVTLTDVVFGFNDSPVMAYDSKRNRAVVAAATGAPGAPEALALINLTTGDFQHFGGVGGGFVNGIAVDSEAGIACTTSELDFSVEFYDLKTKKGFRQFLPGADNQLQSGSDVAFDSVNKLFLVAQSVSSTGAGSSIHVYDVHGNLVESLDGFNFSNTSNVVRTHIALNPAHRTGYVDGPDPGVTQLQSFTY